MIVKDSSDHQQALPIKLPASITNLDTTLSEVKAKDLTHSCKGRLKVLRESSGEAPEVSELRVCRVM